MNYLTSTTELNKIYESVFRTATEQSGFYYQDFGSEIDAITFKQKMVKLKEELSEICKVKQRKKLLFQSIGRFNQQNSSRFHRDTADEFTFLMLGYEPTRIQSKVFIADYTKYIEDVGISLESFFGKHIDANTIENENVLESYTTELTPFSNNNYRLLLLNNSKSFKEKTFGVFHKGEIFKKIDDENRVLNYMMLNLSDLNQEEIYDKKAINNFINN